MKWQDNLQVTLTSRHAKLSENNAKSGCRNISKIELWKLEGLVLNKTISATLIVGAR